MLHGHCCCVAASLSSEIYVQALTYHNNMINFAGRCQVPSLFHLLHVCPTMSPRSLTLMIRQSANQYRESKTLVTALSRAWQGCWDHQLQALNLHLASVPFYQVNCLQEISFFCFERWRYNLLLTLRCTFFVSSFYLQDSKILCSAVPQDNRLTGIIKAIFFGCC